MPNDAAVDASASAGSAGGVSVVLRSLHFRLLWLGLLFMFLAVMGQNIARSWLARELTGTNAGLGGVLFTFGVATTLLAPMAGVVADRFPKRAVIVGSNLTMMCASLFVAIALTLGVLEYWMLLVASGVQGAAFVIYGPCAMAFSAEIVERAHIASAVSLFQITTESMRIVGPAVVGAILTLGASGEQLTFFGGAALFAVAALAVLRIPKATTRQVPKRSPIADLRVGLSYLGRRPDLRLLMLASFLVVIFGFPYNAFLPTVAANLDVGAGGYGTMSAVLSVGAVLAALVVAGRGMARLWVRMVTAGFVFGAGVIALGVVPTFLLVLLVMPVIGGGAIIFNSSNQSMVLVLSDIEYHGRLQGLLMVGFGAQSMVALPLGVLADHVGLRPTLVGMGVAVVVVIAIAHARRSSDPSLVGEHDLG